MITMTKYKIPFSLSFMDLAQWLDAIHSMSLPSFLLFKLLLVTLPVAQIAMGAVYLNECPLQHYIPVYLVVCGVFCTGHALLCCLPSCPGLDLFCIVWNSLISVFMFCWFITGNVWIYSIYPPNYNATEPGQPYCNKTLYLFAFWTTTLTYIPLAFFVLICVLHCSRRGFTNVFFFA